DIRKQRFCKNCEAPQNRCKAADARQRVAALLGGMQDPITQQMPLCRQSFAALFSYGTARKPRAVCCCIRRAVPAGAGWQIGWRFHYIKLPGRRRLAAVLWYTGAQMQTEVPP